MTITNVCVFCSASNKVADEFKDIAAYCGQMLLKFNINLIYGGGNCGLMGVIARTVRDGGGTVIGVYPKLLQSVEPLNPNMDKVITVDAMSQRKDMMIGLADAFLILPGGFGTLDELFEVITLKLVKQHDKPIIIYNHKGFWDDLVKLCDHVINQRFAFSYAPQSYSVVDTLEDAFKQLGYV